MEDYSFTITNDDGLDVKCDTLLILYPESNESNDKTYILYTDYTLDEESKFKLYMSELIQNNDEWRLEDVKNPEEIPELWQAFQDTLNDLNSN